MGGSGQSLQQCGRFTRMFSGKESWDGFQKYEITNTSGWSCCPRWVRRSNISEKSCCPSSLPGARTTQDDLWTWGGVSGMSGWEETPGQTQNMQERSHLELGTSCSPPKGVGGRGLRRGWSGLPWFNCCPWTETWLSGWQMSQMYFPPQSNKYLRKSPNVVPAHFLLMAQGFPNQKNSENIFSSNKLCYCTLFFLFSCRHLLHFHHHRKCANAKHTYWKRIYFARSPIYRKKDAWVGFSRD